MRRFTVLVSLLLLVGFVSVPAYASVDSDQFAGSWFGYDPAPPAGDGSFMTLDISSRGAGYSVTLYDTLASAACSPAAPVTLRGFGKTHNANLRAQFRSVRCDGGVAQIGSAAVLFSLQPDGTLLDSFGVTWFRQGE